MSGKITVKKGELRHIHIEPNHDGTAQVTLHKKVAEGRKNSGPWLSDNSEDKLGAKDHNEAAEHVRNALSAHFGKGGDAAGVRGGDASARGKKATPKAEGDSHPVSDDGPNAEYA